MQFHRIYVQLKSGGQAMASDLQPGSAPNHGTEIDVLLITGRTVKARVSHSEGSKQSGIADHVVTDVYAEEIDAV